MQTAGKMLTQVSENPWATVCADFVGPLPRSKHGNQMLLVLILQVDWIGATARRDGRITKESFLGTHNCEVWGPESSHNGQRSTVCQPNFQEFPGRNGNHAKVHSSIHPVGEPDWESEYDGDDNDSAVRRAEPKKLTQGREPRLQTALYDRDTVKTGRPTETPEEKANKLREILVIVKRNLPPGIRLGIITQGGGNERQRWVTSCGPRNPFYQKRPKGSQQNWAQDTTDLTKSWILRHQ